MRAITDFGQRFNALFESGYGDAVPWLDDIRSELRTAAEQIFGSTDSGKNQRLGFNIEFNHSTESPFQFSDSTGSQFKQALKTVRGADAYNTLLFETEQSEGLVDRMLRIATTAERQLSIELAMTGTFVDVWA